MRWPWACSPQAVRIGERCPMPECIAVAPGNCRPFEASGKFTDHYHET